MLFQLEMHAKFPLCAATFLTCSDFWFLHQMNAAPPKRELSPNRAEMLPSAERLPLTCLQTRAWIFEIWSRLKRAVAQQAGYRSSLRIFPAQASNRRIKLQRKYNGQEPNDILKGRIKLKMLGLGLNSKNIFLSLFIQAPFIS